MTAPAPGDWPLSAAATAVLRDQGVTDGVLFKLTLRELVLRDVVRVDVEQRRLRGPRIRLSPGSRTATGLPAPAPLLAAALLRHVPAGGEEAVVVVRRTVKRSAVLGMLRVESREALVAHGLLVEERWKVLGVLPRTRWVRTPEGEAWAAVPRGLEHGGPLAAGGASLVAAGLLLALDSRVARTLTGADGAGAAVSAVSDIDPATLDAVLGDLGAGLDGAFDSGGGADGGGSGDGGGGDGGSS